MRVRGALGGGELLRREQPPQPGRLTSNPDEQASKCKKR
jgi:hypothetical protein